MEKRVVEIEEVVVGNDKMTIDEYVQNPNIGVYYLCNRKRNCV